MTVAELGRRMTARELAEWMAHDRLDRGPVPSDPAGLRAAMDARAVKALDLMKAHGARRGARR